MVGVLALSPGVNTRAGAGHERQEIGPESGELESVWVEQGHSRGWPGASEALAAGWKIVNSQRMLFACMRPGEAAQVLRERQPAQGQGRASS